MIEDPHERTRAILWMLADLNPSMPLLEALGQLKAVEATLELERAQRDLQELQRAATAVTPSPSARLPQPPW